MSRRSRAAHKGRRESGTFSAIPHAVQDSSNWRQSSGTAIKLLCDLLRQFNGKNNGDLCASISVLRSRGWSSPETLLNALRELRHNGLILLTRQGGLHGASLYALTWLPINDCGGKLECAPTKAPPGEWKVPVAPFKRPVRNRKASTDSGARCDGFRSGEPP